MSITLNGEKKNVAAIISEYNPFHNGHRFHIDETRRKGADFIIAIMSGSVVQRGETAIFDKHFRARQAVIGGCDLVIELPYPYSGACAEMFAKGGISIADGLGITDCISFGCESDDAGLLKKAAGIAEEIKTEPMVAELMKTGISYPAAVSEAVRKLYGDEVSCCFENPNNTLAIEYIKAINEICPNIGIIPIKRKGIAHDSGEIAGNISSASHIRSKIRSGEGVGGLIPYDIKKEPVGDVDRLSNMIFTVLLSDKGSLSKIPQELEIRTRAVLEGGGVTTFSGLVDAVKSKNFTRARISRELLSAFVCSVSRTELIYGNVYARVLAFNENGRLLLREIDENNKGIAVSASLSELRKANPILAELDNLTSRLQALSCGMGITNEYTRKFGGFTR